MTTLPLNIETLKITGITDMTQIQHITETIPSFKTIIDPRGNLLNDICYIPSSQSNFNILNITDSNSNIIVLK